MKREHIGLQFIIIILSLIALTVLWIWVGKLPISATAKNVGVLLFTLAYIAGICAYLMSVFRLVDQNTPSVEHEIFHGQETSEKVFQLISGASQSAIAIFDDKQKVLFWNKAAERIFGYSREEAKKLRLSDFMPERFQSEYLRSFSKFAKTGEGEWTGKTREAVAVRKNGEKFPIDSSISSVRSQGRWYILAVIHDISERKAREVVEHEQQKQHKEFVSMIAHQLREPLTSMRWSLESILNEDFGKVDGELHEVLGEVEELNHRTIGLVRDMLNIARLETGSATGKKDQVDLQTIVKTVVNDLDTLAKQRGVEVKKSVRHTEVYVDKRMMREVVQNLMENALRYSKEGDTVEIRVEDVEDRVLLTVEDTGIGIPKEDQKKIFNKFYRGSNTENETQGSGLGLYFAKKIVEAHGGEISFESELGKGTTFKVNIPKED